jgi:tRNA A-37 threonylcarbamoyl transferase component Bud32
MALNLATQTDLPGDDVGPGGTKVVKPPPAPLPTPEELAKLFPQFEILECLGCGGMGAVYKARQPKLDRFVALKILLPERQGDAAFAERFSREARALARLNHPAIVAVHDFGEAGGYPYLAMEYVDGLSLRQLLQRGKLASEEALAIVPKICEALQFAHQQGIVHRDIKPENILLDKAGQVKIADFGIAKILAPGAQDFSLTGGKDVVGTPHYMAPEQVEHPTKVDHRADIFSLGVVFYEMLTGELPLGKFQPPSKKVQVDVRLDEVVLRALEKEPERRYQQASQVKTDVETIASTRAALAADRTPGVPESRPATPPPAAPKPNRWEVGLIASGLTVYALLLALIPTVSPPYNYILGVLCAIGLTICALTLAGWWPAPSFLVPDSGFSGRNLPSRKRADFSRTAGREQAASGAPGNEHERIRRAVKGPAIGLLVTGILNWILIPIAIVVFRWVFLPAWQGPALRLSGNAVNGFCAASLALSSFIIYAALKMMRLESHGGAATASIAAILVTPGNIIGVPVGIWSLATLARRNVRAAFQKSRSGGWDIATWGAFIAFGVLGAYAVQIGGRLIGTVIPDPTRSFSVEWTHKAVEKPPGDEAAAKAPNPHRKFVRLVADQTAMTFEGRPTSWDEVGALLATVSDRENTVLEFAVTSDQLTVAQQNEWFQKATLLARQRGFEYASFIGIHPLGSKGTPGSFTFGPVIERTVSGEGDRNRRFIDFDTGRQFAAAEFFGPKAEPSPEETQKWWKQNGLDAMGDTSPAIRGLVGLELIAAPVPAEEWNMAPARLEYYLASSSPGTPATMSGKGDLPATFVIKTRQGTRGVLQITGFTNNPPGIRIRYRLATSR